MYSAEILRANIMRMQAAFAILEQLICFAAKANGNLAMLSTYATAGWDSMWLPAAMHRLHRASADPELCTFAGVSNTGAELKLAAGAGEK
jgi:diaminopimelate decarboxylase